MANKMFVVKTNLICLLAVTMLVKDSDCRIVEVTSTHSPGYYNPGFSYKPLPFWQNNPVPFPSLPSFRVPPMGNAPGISITGDYKTEVNTHGPEIERVFNKIAEECEDTPLSAGDMTKIHANVMKMLKKLIEKEIKESEKVEDKRAEELGKETKIDDVIVLKSTEDKLLLHMFIKNLFDTLKETCNESAEIAKTLNPHLYGDEKRRRSSRRKSSGLTENVSDKNKSQTQDAPAKSLLELALQSKSKTETPATKSHHSGSRRRRRSSHQ